MNNLARWIKRNPFSTIFIFLGLISVTALVLFIVNFFGNGISKQPADWATFATYVSGTIGTLIGLVSIVLLYQTLMRQTELSRLQQFESTFFNLLENQNEILKSLKHVVRHGTLRHAIRSDSEESTTTYEGREYINFIVKAIDYLLPKTLSINLNSQSEETAYKTYINEKFQQLYEPNKRHLGHYFRSLYNIVKYVEEAEIQNPKKYVDLIQSQLSDNELYLVFLDVISDLGYKRFYPLVKKYYFFENLSSRGVWFDKTKVIFFPETNFKDNTPQ